MGHQVKGDTDEIKSRKIAQLSVRADLVARRLNSPLGNGINRTKKGEAPITQQISYENVNYVWLDFKLSIRYSLSTITGGYYEASRKNDNA
jgi:hypothetical protein